MTGSTETGRLATRAADAFSCYRDGELGRMDELVELLTPLLWHTARGQGLSVDGARDVVQTGWLRLVEQADRIGDPQAVMSWLMVTVRREAWRQLKINNRTETGVDPEADRPAPGPDPAQTAVLSAEQRVLWRHVMELSERCRTLLRVIAFSDRPDYAAVAQALRMPVGSIGPTRGRCLAKLRAALRSDPTWPDPEGGQR